MMNLEELKIAFRDIKGLCSESMRDIIKER